MGRPRTFTATIEELQALRDRGYTIPVIARHYGVSENTISLAFNPEARERAYERARQWRAKQPKKDLPAKREPWAIPENPTIEDYMLPRQRVKVEGAPPAPEHPTLTGRLLGDPRPGRSALDKLRRQDA